MSKGGGRENSGTFETRVVTFNAGGWAAMQEFLQTTTAEIACIQETKILGHLVAEKSDHLRKAGWQTIWAPSILTEQEGTSWGSLHSSKKNPRTKKMFCGCPC